MKYPITLDALEVLDAIARKGSFAAAASDLNRVPSAISYTVQKLEQDLDVTVFRKEGRTSVLTETGQLLLEQGRELLEASQRLAVAAKSTHHGWEPVFTIAIDSVLDTGFIYPVIKKFYGLQPRIEINMYEEVLGGALEAVNTGRADLVVGVGTGSIPARGIKSRAIGSIDWLFVAAPGHPIHQARLPLAISAIEPFRFVVVRDSARHQAAQSRRLFSKLPVLSVASISAKINVLCQGLGVGFLPAHRIQDKLAAGELLALPLAMPIEPETLALAWKRNHSGKVLHWFIGQLAEMDFPAAVFGANSGPE